MSDVTVGDGSAEVELTVVTMTFDAADEAALLAVLSKYVVLTRMVDGCRNVDLCASVTRPGRHLVIQKWDARLVLEVSPLVWVPAQRAARPR